MLDAQNFGDIFRGQLVRERRDTFANHQRAYRARRILRDLLRRRQRLETRVVPLPLPQFGDNKNFHG